MEPPNLIPPVDAKTLFAPYELIGPDAPPGSTFKARYRVIDRTTTKGVYPGQEHEYTEKTRVILIIEGHDPIMLKPIAEAMFGEFKRRLLYEAEKTQAAIKASGEIARVVDDAQQSVVPHGGTAMEVPSNE
jgi:hypothetical protein